jgi:hypothetical protein
MDLPGDVNIVLKFDLSQSSSLLPTAMFISKRRYVEVFHAHPRQQLPIMSLLTETTNTRIIVNLPSMRIAV